MVKQILFFKLSSNHIEQYFLMTDVLFLEKQETRVVGVT